MLTIESRVGRLLEIRISSPSTTSELDSLRSRKTGLIEKMDDACVCAADLRHAHVFSQLVSDGFLELIAGPDRHMARSALLINGSAVFGLQAERTLRQANEKSRRAFRHPADLETWLAEVLTEAEQLRLREFLLESNAASTPTAAPADGGFRPVPFD